MFQFPRCPPHRYGLAMRSWVMKPTGLPHSEIPGYASTRLTEAYRSVATSFIGPRRPGIHPAPILVCVQRRPGLRSAARGKAGVNGSADRKSGDAAALAVGRPCPARSGGHTTTTALTRIPRGEGSRNMMSTTPYVVGKVHRRGLPRRGATGPVNHRSAPVSASADRGSLGRLWKLNVQDQATKEACALLKPQDRSLAGVQILTSSCEHLYHALQALLHLPYRPVD